MRISFSLASVMLVALLAFTTTGCKSGPSLAWWKKDKAAQDKFAGPPSQSFTPSTRADRGVASNTQNRSPGPGFNNYPDTNRPDPRFGSSPSGGFDANRGGTNSQFSSYPGTQANSGTGQSAPCHACATGYCAMHKTNLSGVDAPKSSIYGDGPRTADSRNQWDDSSSGSRWDGTSTTEQSNWDQPATNPTPKTWNNDQGPSSNWDSQPTPKFDEPYDSKGPGTGAPSYGAKGSAGGGFGAANDAYSQPPVDTRQIQSSSSLPAELTRKDPNDWQGPGSVGKVQAAGFAKGPDPSYSEDLGYGGDTGLGGGDSGLGGGDFQGGGSFSGPNYERTALPDNDPYYGFQR